MSAPAVKPALPAPSGAQAPRVGSGAPPNAPSNAPPPSATGAPKLSPNPTGVSPIKPPVPPNTNHAVSSAVPLSLVQEHKVQGNALSPQQAVGLQRTPEKPKELPPVMSSPQGPKPTSNGVEGSPGKVSHPPVPLLPTIADKKTTEDAVGAAIAMLNHSTEAGLPPTGSGPTPAPLNTPASNVSALPTLPVPQQPPAPVSSNASTPTSSHPPAPPTQQSPMKPEPLPTPAAPVAASAPAAPVALAPQAASPPKVSAPPAVTSSPSKPENSVASATESKQPPATSAPVAAAVVAPDTQSSNQPAPAPASGPGPGATGANPAPESPAKPAPPAPPEVTKTRIEISKPEFKVATPRVSKRKRETKPAVEMKSSEDPNDDRKSKRVRTRTQPYQSPLPELTYIVKIKNLIKNKMKDSKATDDKLIVFYKNEFLAVRNAEGSFYVCQAMQNIYKSSTRIRIRWLSQDKKENKATDVYIPDFYDVTEFDCILTNLELKKLDKNKFQLPQEEMDRTQSILKRAIDVEKGVAEKPPITEEHPDGLDLSLYRDEAQLKKKKQRNSQKASKKTHKKAEKDGGEKEEGDNESEESQGEMAIEESLEDGEKKKKSNKMAKSKANKKEKSAKKEKKAAREKEAAPSKKERTSERGRDATKRRAEGAGKNTAAKPPPEKKAKAVASPKPTRKAEKPEAVAESSVPTRATKSRSAKTAVSQSSSKTSPVTRIKERERRTVSTAGRKKPGKKA